MEDEASFKLRFTDYRLPANEEERLKLFAGAGYAGTGTTQLGDDLRARQAATSQDNETSLDFIRRDLLAEPGLGNQRLVPTTNDGSCTKGVLPGILDGGFDVVKLNPGQRVTPRQQSATVE